MSLGGRVFAAMYDRQLAGVEKAGLAAHRGALLAGVSGRVLEVGAGTGANLPYYSPDVALTLTEPEPPMVKRLQAKVRELRPEAMVLRAPAEDLPFDDDTFDVVVATLTLCTVRDPAAALGEIRRVLRPEGRLLFIEHVRSDNPKIARLQDRMNGLSRFVLHGCNCNRATVDGLRIAGFTVEQLQHSELPKSPPFVRPLVIGSASARADLSIA
jgi:ubiquinone/menaquinone biosynthesis C-methylase UbiE